MFYLREFLKLIKENFIVGLFFILSTAFTITISHNQDSISNVLAESQKSSGLPYFNALVSGSRNFDAIIRKMKSLPGVSNVLFQGEKALQKEIKSLQGQFGSHVLKNFSSTDHKNIRIELTSGIKEKSQSLIREYLGRLAGLTNVTMTEVRKPLKIKKKEKTLAGFFKLGEVYILSIASAFWCFSLFLFMKPMSRYGFIIQKFQRKKNVPQKIVLAGIVGIVFISLVGNFYLNSHFSLSTVAVPCLMIFIALGMSTITGSKYRA